MTSNPDAVPLPPRLLTQVTCVTPCCRWRFRSVRRSPPRRIRRCRRRPHDRHGRRDRIDHGDVQVNVCDAVSDTVRTRSPSPNSCPLSSAFPKHSRLTPSASDPAEARSHCRSTHRPSGRCQRAEDSLACPSFELCVAGIGERRWRVALAARFVRARRLRADLATYAVTAKQYIWPASGAREGPGRRRSDVNVLGVGP